MKIKNIAAGDFVQIKKSLCHSEFKAKQVCEVIDIDHTDKYGFDVLIQGKNCLDWVSHKDLKKPVERDIAKELLEVDLSSELTGSELCKAMLARGDYHVMCAVSDISESDAILSCNSAVITSGEIRGAFTNSFDGLHEHAVPINNQGEPLTASEVGL